MIQFIDARPAAAIPTLFGIANIINVLDPQYNVRRDGSAGSTPGIQSALNDAGAAGRGTIVWFPPGNYLVEGPLTVPNFVQIHGSWQAPPSPNGIRDSGSPLPTDGGTTFLITAPGSATATAAFTLGWSALIEGICFYYPNQSATASTPTSYPYTVRMASNAKNASVRNCCFLNSYGAVDITNHERGLVTDCFGQPLAIGINVDACSDITRLGRIHWNPIWSYNSAVYNWSFANGVRFQFGRSDEQYCEGLFCFGYLYGIRLYQSNNSYPSLSGGTYGTFVGCSMDGCGTPIRCENTSYQGVDILGGGFITVGGDNNYVDMLGGALKIVGARFWNGNTSGINQTGGILQMNSCKYRDPINLICSGGILGVHNGVWESSNSAINTQNATKATLTGNTLVGGTFNSIVTSGSSTILAGNN